MTTFLISKKIFLKIKGLKHTLIGPLKKKIPQIVGVKYLR